MIIFRYLSKELYTHLLAITLVLLIIFITNQFVHYLQLVANGQLTTTAVMKMMSLQIPLLIGYLLPLGFYLAILLVFSRLYLDHEMTVLAACGVSKIKLLSMVMIFGLLVAGVVAWLMIWVEPVIESYRLKALDEVLKNGAVEALLPRQFQSIGNLGVVYTQKVIRPTHEMKDIFLALQKTENNKTVWDITVASSAREQKDPQGGERFLEFKDGYRYVGTPGEKNFQVMKFNNYGLRLSNPNWHMPLELDRMTLSELWSLRHTNPKAAAMVHWRIAMPISVLLLVLLAVPLARSNPRLGRFGRLFPAIIIYTIYADLIFLGRAWIERGMLRQEFGLWWLHASLLLLGIILMAWDFGWLRFKRKKVICATA